MHSLLLLALSILCTLEQNAHGMSTEEVIHSGVEPSPDAELRVKENWRSNELVFTWDPEYFKRFFEPGANIVIQATAYLSETDEAIFTATGIGILSGSDGGTATITILHANKEKILKFSHYYVLKPVGTQSHVHLSSGVIRPIMRGRADNQFEF
ncbi:hypothetical protein HA402_001236 [Bradysia odoriphaga]|nr:hypothetical protein HA402_001236 [Bradysia odoriphaga]